MHYRTAEQDARMHYRTAAHDELDVIVINNSSTTFCLRSSRL